MVALTADVLHANLLPPIDRLSVPFGIAPVEDSYPCSILIISILSYMRA